MKREFQLNESRGFSTRQLLRPLSAIYAVITRIRNSMFDRGLLTIYKSSLPVICVGNISVGGTGKTPFTRYLARQLRRQGMRPVVLSRGYGGSRRGPWLISESDSFSDVGDEPLMLAQDSQLPVVVSRSRVRGAQFIEREGLGDIIILDDGYQHRWLARDINIVCVNASGSAACQEFIDGELLPSGIFRERKAPALQRASLVVLSSRSPQVLDLLSERVIRMVQELPAGLPWVASSLSAPAVRSLTSGVVLPAQQISLLCAIGNPEGFIATLEYLGFSSTVRRLLPDHSPLLEQVCRKMLDELALPIVMTEKDAIKLPVDLRQNSRLHVLQFDLALNSPAVVDALLAPLVKTGRERRGE